VEVAMSHTADDLLEFHADHRRRTGRQVRHNARASLHAAVLDDEALEDVDAICPKDRHDIGRHTSPKPHDGPKPGRRKGFKVWKTPFWKRRRALWAKQNAAARRLVDTD